MPRLHIKLQSGEIYTTGQSNSLAKRITEKHRELRKPGCLNELEIIDEILLLERTKKFMATLKRNL